MFHGQLELQFIENQEIDQAIRFVSFVYTLVSVEVWIGAANM